ncbi:MAG: glycosyltransferase family 2 protein [Chloroflexi bacterium]|nr:glycosyltransferase family 2 protein [Chloroflexota bacterium]
MIRPFVSVLMPIRNEADFIARSLAAVLRQDYPHDRMEVLIADGMSTDETRAIVAETARCYPDVPVTLVDNPQKIVPTGLNRLMAQARGSIIIRVDGHCEIEPDYVSRCVQYLQQSDIAGVGGPIETIGSDRMSTIIAAAMSSAFGVGGSAFRTVKDRALLVDTIAFPAYKREVIEAAGPYDEELVRNQDDEYNYRLRSMGYQILLAPDIRSRYYSRSSLRALWRQYFQYGYWKVRVLQKHPLQMSLRQFVPPAFVLVALGGALLAPFSRVFRALWLSALTLYAAANLVASWLVVRKSDVRQLPALSLVFAILHFSYGLGFLRGTVRFARRFRDMAR